MTSAQVDQVLATLNALEQAVKRQAEEIRLLRLGQREGGQEMLTKRETARLLGVHRSTTLKALIDTGQVKTVPFGKTVRIPRSEIARIRAQGLAPKPSSVRKKKAQPRLLKLEGLRYEDLLINAAG